MELSLTHTNSVCRLRNIALLFFSQITIIAIAFITAAHFVFTGKLYLSIPGLVLVSFVTSMLIYGLVVGKDRVMSGNED